MRGPRDIVLKTLLIWVTLLTSVILWLPLVRGPMNGDSYQWNLVDGIGGHGIGGDYWMLIIAFAYVLALQVSGRRGPRALFPILLLPLLIVFNTAILYAAWKYPEVLRFEGATFGIDVSLAQILPTVFTLFTVTAMGWTFWRRTHGGFETSGPPWIGLNTTILSVAAAMLLLQFVLFRYGGAMGNQLGVVLTLVQWFVFNAGLNAYSSPETRTST